MLKRSDGRWQEKITLPGMAKPKYFYGKTQKEVKQKLAAWKHEQTQGKSFEAASDAWDVWHTDKVSYNGAEAYRAALKRTKEHFAGRKLQDIGPDEIDAYIRYLAGRGYARRTVQLHLDMLNMIYDYSIVNRWAELNPCNAVKLPAGLPKGRRDIPTDEELEKVKNGIEYEFGLFPFMLLYTGLRRGELLALRWEDIDLDKKLIRVERAVYFAGNTPQIKEPKTEAGKRSVVLLDALREVLPQPGTGYIFGGEKPLTKIQVRKRWINWCRDAGLATGTTTQKKGKNGREYESTTWEADITPHQLRHAFATILFDAGIDVKDAQEILGHASIQVTRDIYTHIRQQRREDTADRLNAFLQGENGAKKQDRCQNVVIFPGSNVKQG